MMTADAIIAALNLQPHPEGGWFAVRWVAPGEGRPPATSIYFLLRRGETSHWHQLDAAEVWNFHAGASLSLRLAETRSGPATAQRLGPDLEAGERPQAVVPAGYWQSARSLGEWTLVGCAMVPGWHESGFVLAPPGFDIPG